MPAPTNITIATGSVQAKIARFGGGPATMSLVQKRKDQLQKKWDQDKVPKTSTKSKWLSASGAGIYKKRFVLERHA